jgi:hypothetical protein
MLRRLPEIAKDLRIALESKDYLKATKLYTEFKLIVEKHLEITEINFHFWDF